jgi:hypothetical protein
VILDDVKDFITLAAYLRERQSEGAKGVVITLEVYYSQICHISDHNAKLDGVTCLHALDKMCKEHGWNWKNCIKPTSIAFTLPQLSVN